MLSPQELQVKKFEKAVFGGYDMSQVDDFLDSIISDYTSLFRENGTLKGKMKVLVDKVEEYRSVDDEIRKMLYSAQVNSKEIITAAQREGEAVISAARATAETNIQDMKKAYDLEVLRLNAIKTETAGYADQMKALLRKNIEVIDTYIEKAPAPPPEELTQANDSYKMPSADTFEFSLPKDFIVDKEEVHDTKELNFDSTLTSAPTHRAPHQSIPTLRPEPQNPIIGQEEELPTKFFEVQLGNKEKNAHKKTVEDAEESDTGKIYGNSPFTPKPRFKFDDLRFGADYEEDDDNK